jgi:hypothetical protein
MMYIAARWNGVLGRVLYVPRLAVSPSPRLIEPRRLRFLLTEWWPPSFILGLLNGMRRKHEGGVRRR